MASVTKVTNNSNTHLVVRSLKVLEGIEGAGITEIKSTVEALSNAQTSLASKTQDYWSTIASDNNITAEEKKTLYKEWKTIQSEYTALLKQAEEESISEETTAYVNYKAAYTALYNELITTLKLFDSMSTTTTISDRDSFIAYYDTYYSTKETLKSLIYQTQGATTYVLDLSPEYITIAVDGDGNYIDSSATITLEVNLYSGTDGQDYAKTRYATVNNTTVGTWDGNKVTVPVTSFTENTNTLTITVADENGYIFSGSAIVAKLYAGNSIESVTTWFLVTDKKEGVTKDESGWSTTPDTMTDSKPYLWTYQEITFIDGSTKETEAVLTGASGASGNGISSIKTYYLASGYDSGITVEDSGWTEEVQTITSTEPYLWKYEKIIYTDGSEVNTDPVIIGKYSDSLTMYSMLLSTKSIKADDTGVISPTYIKAKKYETTTEYTRETQTGVIKVTIDGEDAGNVDEYKKDTSGSYDSTKTYYKKFTPILLKLEDNVVLESDDDTAAVIYIRS